jgi:hypothetical protein
MSLVIRYRIASHQQQQQPAACSRHCVTYIGYSPPNGPIQHPTDKPRLPLGMPNANAMKQLRGLKHENWPACDPRAAPPEEYGLKS